VGVKVGVVGFTVAATMAEGVIGAAVAVRFSEAAAQPARPGTSKTLNNISRNDIGLIPPFIIHILIRRVKNRIARSKNRTGLPFKMQPAKSGILIESPRTIRGIDPRFQFFR
jgi:hypothetical protein